MVGDYPTRMILEGVPRLSFEVQGDRSPEGMPFPSSLRACLEFMGEDYGFECVTEQNKSWRLDRLYTYLLGVSGAAFRLSWKSGWHGDNVAIIYMSPDPHAPFDRAFEAVDYAYETFGKQEGRDNEAYFRQRI